MYHSNKNNRCLPVLIFNWYRTYTNFLKIMIVFLIHKKDFNVYKKEKINIVDTAF